MCHCKTCADRLHVIIVTIAIAIPYSLASCLIRFRFLHTLHGVLYALPIVHDTSSKNAQVSSATTSFLWRHTNTYKNHGYNAVADDSGQVSSAKRHFLDVLTPARITDITLSQMTLGKCRLLKRDVTLTPAKNHGYNAVVEVSCAGSPVVPRILHSLPTKVRKVEKG